MGKAEWGGNPGCCWLGLYFCFVCCLDEVSCTGCYWWLGDAGLLFKWFPLWVLTIWYTLGLVLCYLGSWSQCSHSKGSGLYFQMVAVQTLVAIPTTSFEFPARVSRTWWLLDLAARFAHSPSWHWGTHLGCFSDSPQATEVGQYQFRSPLLAWDSVHWTGSSLASAKWVTAARDA